MTNEQELILWIVVMVVAAFGSGCSLGSTFRTKHPKKEVSNARRK